jgi:pimeloyl-ACP methyl ester carboxylesterase
MPQVTVNGVELYYEECGTGEEVVVSAQMAFGSFSYQRLLALPPAGYRVYMVTPRGYGKSSHVWEDYGNRWYSIWAEDVYQFSRKLGLDRFIYTGASHGAGVGWHLVLEHPEAVKAFISVVGAPHDRAGGDTSEGRRKTIEAADDPGRIEEVIGLLFSPTSDEKRLERRRQIMEEMRKHYASMSREELVINPRKPLAEAKTNEELAALLSRVRVPTLLICGMQDNVIPPEMSLLAARAIPGAKAVFFQDEGHMLPAESPEKVVAEIVSFVSSLR